MFNYPVHNTGGHYNTSSGVYTVPLDGTYEFIFRLRASADATIGAYLVLDGEDVSEILLNIILVTAKDEPLQQKLEST